MIKTRFSPSPTGFLHIGGARTALYAYLYAKKHKGSFILRIEDTDTERSTQASIDAILASMQWLGLDAEPPIFYQSKRLAIYQRYCDQLLKAGHAYRCTCSKERLTQLRERQLAAKEKPRYDGACREKNLDHADEKPAVIRFKTPKTGDINFTDEVYGDIQVKQAELDDLVLLRSDGMPTYNFTVVIDDWQMGITHVIRGDDHINNTPRQINILRALEAPVPIYAHLPMILGEDGKRLSKRHGAVSVMAYADEGYLPEALLNYLARLGWSHGDNEIFSLTALCDLFDLKHVHRSPASFNVDKLQWLNHHYLKAMPEAELKKALLAQYEHQEIILDHGPSVTELIPLYLPRIKTLKAFVEQTLFFYDQKPVVYESQCAKNHLTASTKPIMVFFREQLTALPDFSEALIKGAIKATLAHFSIKMPVLAQALRTAVIGHINSPGIGTILALLGLNKTLTRLDAALKWIDESSDAL